MMTVGELIEILKEEDQDSVVIIQSDAEGNSFSPLYNGYSASYKPETTWSGTVGLEMLTQKDINEGYTEEDVVRGKQAIVLVPVK
jgi:hypothetical protein